MKNKKIIIPIIAVAVAAVIGSALYLTVFQKGSADREANARHIIQMMMTSPNTELYDPNAATILGADVSEEEKARRKEANEIMQKNWENGAAAFFAPNCFSSFMNTAALTYLGEADAFGQTFSVKDITLTSQDETSQDFMVTLLVNGEERQESIRFRNDENGLFTFVEIQMMG